MWRVYFLKSKLKKWYYVGSTNNIQRRITEHNSGKVSATKAFRPLELVFTQECPNGLSARALEKKIKKQRLLKERIIRTINK